MKLKILFGVTLAAIGGVLYAHKRRGGTLSLDSFKESFGAAKKAVQGAVKDVAAKAGPERTDRFGYSEYTVAKADRDLH